MQARTARQHGTARPWRLARVLAVLGLLCAAVPAQAALWGYIDADGVAHFADARLDDRYKLFMKDGGQFDSGDLGHRGVIALGDKPSPERDKLFRYLLNHPNMRTVEPIIEKVAGAQNVDPALVKAVMAVESGFNASAVSPKGAIGLMQVIPDTGARFGVAADKRRTVEQKLADPKLNIAAGVRYLRFLMALFPDNLELVLAAYNAGEGAVQRYNNQIPPYPETRQYVSTVLEFYRLYQRGQPGAGGVIRTGVAADRVRMVIGGGRRPMP
ncbi:MULTISPECIES: lytic transglycosylase domain-containing protein [Cupriavidus]|uniref:Lytic transglycosylase domain-containing protein n=1 Tax=Cupriavidus pauculus TaxID=82633 RepID=A0A3G8H337_9BURK|nr:MULTISPECIES: transglycosylase SLT domain-containing protein [Cupriavidus]AZG13892.1 lytic transglycosylase domain-containing protein [Cupriavidus pauculus]MDT6960096.1 transglycosylase SLT domain-containing protein [Cupriavidus sp. SZY C1]